MNDPQNQDNGKCSKAHGSEFLAAQWSLYVLRGRRALLLDLLANGTSTADDVWDAVELPKGIGASWLSSVPGMLARLGVIRAAGIVRSVRPERHSSLITLWELGDRAAAEDWLAAHPDRPDLANANEIQIPKPQKRNGRP